VSTNGKLQLTQIRCQHFFAELWVAKTLADFEINDLACDYREFRPYVNQHPYGTRFADLVDHTGFVVGKHIGV